MCEKSGGCRAKVNNRIALGSLVDLLHRERATLLASSIDRTSSHCITPVFLTMRLLKPILILAAIYIGIVVAFESLLGYVQPQNDGTLVITTTDDSGNTNQRVLSRLAIDETTYVAVNHWPRAWYRDALERPNVSVNFSEGSGEAGDYLAVPVTQAEHDRLQSSHPVPLPMRFLMGFAPRHFLRLDARGR